MMLVPTLLQASWPTVHPLVTVLAGAVLAAVATGLWKRYDARAAAATAKQNAENIWRQARLDAEQALRDDLKKETQARVQWQLENDGDLARIAKILEDVNETQKLTATLAADSKHHAAELTRINTRVEGIGDKLTQFIMDHARHA